MNTQPSLALINCPACDKQVSNKAMTCPRCGHPLNESESLSKNSGITPCPSCGAMNWSELKISWSVINIGRTILGFIILTSIITPITALLLGFLSIIFDIGFVVIWVALFGVIEIKRKKQKICMNCGKELELGELENS